jgi:hypothetical protein
MNWKDLGKSIAEFAPLLGGVVGGPAGAGIGKIIASTFGVEDKPDIISQAIKADPNAAVKLKQLELDHKVDLEKIELETTRAELEDKKNARDSHKLSYMPSVLSCVLSFVILGIVYLLFYTEPPEGSREVLFMLLGVVVKEWGGAMQYWFGTTRSSAEKTRMFK